MWISSNPHKQPFKEIQLLFSFMKEEEKRTQKVEATSRKCYLACKPKETTWLQSQILRPSRQATLPPKLFCLSTEEEGDL